MGKLFDALEKAHQQYEPEDAKTPAKGTKTGKRKSEPDNIVPFSNIKTPPPAHTLDRNLVAFHAPQSAEAELFKILRTNLLFPQEGKPPKSIMVTSAIPGEGKSLVAGNLAISIAQGIEEHVLLIDADIRRPSMHEYFGVGIAEGLSEYLATGADVSNKLIKTLVPKLTLLTAGRPPANPTELLTTQKMKALISEVSKRYEDRYIIIDSAPISMASETAAISNYVDGIIIVVRAGKTPRKAVSDVIEQLGKEKIVGFVMNHSDQSIKKYYGYGKSYYSSKSKKAE